MSGLNSPGVIQAAIDHLNTLGLFESVQDHETLSAPGNGLTADVWLDSIRPVPLMSGLAESSAMLTLTCRIYINADGLPAGGLETAIAGAVDQVMAAYHGGFTFGALVEQVDLLGAYGPPLGAVGGYIPIGNIVYRCMTITVPCVINDAWPQAQ